MPLRRLALLALAAWLAGCASVEPPDASPRAPSAVRAELESLLPATLRDRAGWAADVTAAFSALRLDARTRNLCAVLAVVEQESSYRADPAVPRLGQMAWSEIERRAGQAGVPMLLVRGALHITSPDGRSYAERIDASKTERELSETFDDFVGMVPLGRRLFGAYNPVRTGGPMQVSIAFAERHAREKPYPYPVAKTLREEVFGRRGGLYFGIAHLLDYPADYAEPIFRFADFNAGRWASRNAAFQRAASLASGIPLELDGDLVREGDAPGATELAVRTLAARLDLGDAAIRRALEQGDAADFAQTTLYRRLFELAERIERRPLPRALLPQIKLSSPKLSRPLTTEWFAKRVDERWRRCMAKAG